MDVFVGDRPPAATQFDLVLSANAAPSGNVTLQEIESLVEDARPALDFVVSDPVASLLRDEFVALVRTVAGVEAVRSGLAGPIGLITHRTSLSRPTRPGRLGLGLASLIGAQSKQIGRHMPDLLPHRVVADARSLRWSRLDAPEQFSGVVFAVGGPSEMKALEGTREILEGRNVAVQLVDFSLVPIGFPAIGGVRPWERPDVSALHEVLTTAWSQHDWWGVRWLPWVDRSLGAMAHVTGREAAVFLEGAMRTFPNAAAVVTAKLRWTRARSLVRACRRISVPTIGIQHGVHGDAIEWEGIETSSFGVTGESFRRVLKRRGYQGTTRVIGAPFFDEMKATHDGVIALRPVEGSIIRSEADHLAHLHAAAESLRRALGPTATIAYRAHPREIMAAEGSAVLAQFGVVEDRAASGRVWVSVESSAVAQAALSGSNVVVLSLNGHQWVHPYSEMPGVWTARTVEALSAAVADAWSAPGVGADDWKREYGLRLGQDAAESLADHIMESI